MRAVVRGGERFVRRAATYGTGGAAVYWTLNQEEELTELAPIAQAFAWDLYYSNFGDKLAGAQYYRELAEGAAAKNVLTDRLQKFRLEKEVKLENDADASRARHIVNNFKGSLDSDDVLNYAKVIALLPPGDADDLLVDCTIRAAKITQKAEKFCPYSPQTAENATYPHRTEVSDTLEQQWQRSEEHASSSSSSAPHPARVMSEEDLALVEKYMGEGTTSKLVELRLRRNGSDFFKTVSKSFREACDKASENGNMLPFICLGAGIGVVVLFITKPELLPPVLVKYLDSMKLQLGKVAGNIGLHWGPKFEELKIRLPFELNRLRNAIEDNFVLLSQFLQELRVKIADGAGPAELARKLKLDRVGDNLSRLRANFAEGLKSQSERLSKAVASSVLTLKEAKIAESLGAQLRTLDAKFKSFESQLFSAANKEKMFAAVRNFEKQLRLIAEKIAELLRRAGTTLQVARLLKGKRDDSITTIASEEIVFVNEPSSNGSGKENEDLAVSARSTSQGASEESPGHNAVD